VRRVRRPSGRLLRPGPARRALPGRVADRLPGAAAAQPPAVHARRQPRLSLPLVRRAVVRGTAVPCRAVSSYCLVHITSHTDLN